MKLLRPALFGLGIITALLGAAVLLAFTPAVQTWAVRRALAGDPSRQIELGRLSAGLSSLRIEHLRVREPGRELVVPWLEADFSVWRAAWSRELIVERLVAQGWTIDLTVPATTAAVPGAVAPNGAPALAGYFAVLGTARAQTPAAVPRGFDGVFGRLELPVSLSLDGADLEGEVRFARGSGQTPARARVAITGGGLRPGANGRFTVASEIVVDDATAPVDRINSRHDLTLRLADTRRFDLVEITGAATATGPQFPNGVRIETVTTASRRGGAEAYGFSLRSGDRVLLALDGSLVDAASGIEGRWTLDARSADLAPFALGRPLPDFASTGQGTFKVDGMFASGQLAGRVDATLRRLGEITPFLSGVDPVRVIAEFDVWSRGDDVRVARLQVDVASARPVASIALLQGVEFNRTTGELRVANLAADLLRIQLTGVPLAWAQPWLGTAELAAEPLTGALVASVRSGRLFLRTSEPLALRGLTLATAGRPQLEGVVVSIDGTLDYAPHAWQAEATRIELRAANRPLATLAGKARKSDADAGPLKLTGDYAIDLPTLLAQPALAAYRGLTAGKAAGSFSASLADVQQVAASLRLSDLAVGGGSDGTVIGLEARADRLADGTLRGELPLTVERGGRRSDLRLSGELKPMPDTLHLTAELAGNEVFLEDLRALSAVIPAGTESSASASAERTAPWSGVEGQIKVNLRKLIQSPQVSVSGVTGTLVIGRNAVRFEDLRASLPEGAALKVGGELGFDPRLTRSYGLKADVLLADFDPVPFFRSLNPAALPPVEGRFDVTARLSGQAADLGGLAGASIGSARLASRGGVLRALSVDASDFARTGARLSSVAGLIGLATGDTRALRYADRLKAATDLAQELSAVAFDQLTLELERTDADDFIVRDFALISPKLRLLGAGRIRHVPEVGFWHRPLSLQLNLGTREKLADCLRTLKLAGDQPDSLGYVPLTGDLQVDGSLSTLGTQMLRDRLLQALAGQD